MQNQCPSENYVVSCQLTYDYTQNAAAAFLINHLDFWQSKARSERDVQMPLKNA